MNYFTNEDFKISSITVDNYAFAALIPQVNYMGIWGEYRNIPTQLECRDTQYWLNDESTLVTIYLESGLTLTYRIKAGYYTDFASSPDILKSFIDSDNRSIIIPAITHDINYGTHTLSFEASNTLFNEMMRYYKMNTIKRVLAYKAVSWFGKSRFEASKQEIHRAMELVQFDFKLGVDKI